MYGESFESNQFAPFAVAAGGGQTVLAPGESYDVTVRFAPSLPGKFATTMSVTSNDTYVPVQVAGAGVVSRPAIDASPAWYSSVPFPSVTPRRRRSRSRTKEPHR